MLGPGQMHGAGIVGQIALDTADERRQYGQRCFTGEIEHPGRKGGLSHMFPYGPHLRDFVRSGKKYHVGAVFHGPRGHMGKTFGCPALGGPDRSGVQAKDGAGGEGSEQAIGFGMGRERQSQFRPEYGRIMQSIIQSRSVFPLRCA